MIERVHAVLARKAQRLAGTRAAQVPALVRSGIEALAPLAPLRGGGLVRKSFVALVILPSLIYFAYAVLWQSKYYVAETRLAVRDMQEKTQELASSASLNSSIQNPFIVLNYIKSQRLLVDLGGAPYMETKFGSSDVDYFSRISQDLRLEDLLKYWLKHVFVSVEVMSGILTMKVSAYHPEDAVAISGDVVRLCENLINEITFRSRRDRLARIESEVSYAADGLAKARAAITIFRQKNVLIDPAVRAQSISELIAKLTSDKIDIENAIATLKGVINSDSPTQRVQRSKLATIDQQIADLKKSLTSPDSDETVAAQISVYERLQLDEQFAVLLYTIAKNAYQQARQDQERQQLYVAVVVNPTLPQDADGPRKYAMTLLVFVSLAIIWSIVALVVASINDHVA